MESHEDHFSSFSFSVTTVGTKWLSVIKSPAMILMEPTLEPGVCSLTQLSNVGYVDITKSFRDSVGCVQMYFRSSVRLIPVTKKPPETQNKHLRFYAGQIQRYLKNVYPSCLVIKISRRIPGLPCFFLCSNASIRASALHLLAHQ